MKSTILDVIVVGAGFAGLSASYYLKKYGLNHIVFERGKIGESWRSQRWDSFKMNSANKLNLLIDDIRINPKRYVSISVFGKKSKQQPLTYPVTDTFNSPYIIQKAH